jgi:hypothetical protein
MKTFGRYSKSNWEARTRGQRSPVLVWVDTAFNGGLVLPRQQIEQLGLREYSSTPAILANGQRVELPTYTCYLDMHLCACAPFLNPATAFAFLFTTLDGDHLSV